jgi:hypothetical protein
VKSASLQIPNDTSAYYTSYQSFLAREISSLVRLGWTPTQIARIFRQRGYRSAKGREIHGKHIHSMLKKNRLTR